MRIPDYPAAPYFASTATFRIYRDVRFSKDKSSYKTNAGIHFRHEVGRQVHGPGLYLHLQPGNVFVGAGIWRPNSATVGKIRGAIVANPDRWLDIVSDASFGAIYTLEAGSLKRALRGIDPDHPLIEHLRLKSFVAVASFNQEEACSPGFIETYAYACRITAPFAGFLTTAIGLDW